MTPVRKWTIVCLVVCLCLWLVLDNLAIGSNFGRFVLSRGWQSEPLTIVRLSMLYDYVEQEDYFNGLHDPMSELVHEHAGSVPNLQAVRFDDLCNTKDAWQQVFLYEVEKGRDYSQMATRAQYRELQSKNAWMVRASAEIAIQSQWQLDTKNSYLLMLIESRIDNQDDLIVSVFSRTVKNHPRLRIVLSERTFALNGKRNFNPNLVLIIAFEEIESLTGWIESIVTQSELAILDGDLEQVHAILLSPQT